MRRGRITSRIISYVMCCGALRALLRLIQSLSVHWGGAVPWVDIRPTKSGVLRSRAACTAAARLASTDMVDVREATKFACAEVPVMRLARRAAAAAA